MPPIERHVAVATSTDIEPYYPAHFTIGSIIDLGGGVLKRVESLKTEDFVRSAETSLELRMDMSTVIHMQHDHERNIVVLGFAVGRPQVKVALLTSVGQNVQSKFLMQQQFSAEIVIQRRRLIV